jgi:hypothetical protein
MHGLIIYNIFVEVQQVEATTPKSEYASKNNSFFFKVPFFIAMY